MNTILNKQDIIGAIVRDLVSRGHYVGRSFCGRYIVINHGASSYYDDLDFMLREWRRVTSNG